MKNNYKIIISIISLISLVLFFALSMLFFALNLDSDDKIKNFSYVETIEYENVVEKEESLINIEQQDFKNFQETGMKILSTSYHEWDEGASSFYFDPLNFENYAIHSLINTSYISPYYNSDDGKIESFISGRKNTDGKKSIYHWEKNEGSFKDYQLKDYDHEMFIYKNKDYILNGSKIWIIDNDKNYEVKFNFLPTMGLSLPPTFDENDNYVSTTGGYHFNSFDIYGENLLINSRDYGTIFSLNILNQDGTLKSEDEFEVNWVLCGNSITPWYIESYYNEDGTWENPIIFNGGEEEAIYYNYDHNEDYVPHIFNEWLDKMLKIEIDGVVYDFTNINQAKKFNELSNDNKFWGAHTVRVINTYLDSVASTIPEYNPENLYISIHDNHFPSDVIFKYLDPTNDRSSGNDPYSYHAYEDSTKALFGDNPYSLENDRKSFTKIYEINTDTMIAKQVLNRDNTISDKINQFSDYRSSSTFFSINGQSYLITESSLNSSFALVAFDGIDFDKQELINERTIMDIQWSDVAGKYIHYRTYPIFNDISNVAYGWNVLNTDPYMG